MKNKFEQHFTTSALANNRFLPPYKHDSFFSGHGSAHPHIDTSRYV